jgi:hypothetical protein
MFCNLRGLPFGLINHTPKHLWAFLKNLAARKFSGIKGIDQ